MFTQVHRSLAAVTRSMPRMRGINYFGRRTTRFLSRFDAHVRGAVKMRDGTQLFLDTSSRTELGAFWTGDYEVPVISFLKRQLRDGGVFVDVGANIGFVTVALAAHLQNQKGRVLAFEPLKSNFERLSQNITLNRLETHVALFNVGLGDRDFETTITLLEDSETGNAVLSSALNDNDGSAGTPSTIQIRSLDAMADQLHLQRADLIKVDIEGAEVLFLQGAQEFIKRFQPIIFGEFNRYFIERFGHSVLDAERQLSPMGYRAYRIGKTIEPINRLEHGMEEIAFVPPHRSLG